MKNDRLRFPLGVVGVARVHATVHRLCRVNVRERWAQLCTGEKAAERLL